jgi:hypothetical protein
MLDEVSWNVFFGNFLKKEQGFTGYWVEME